VPGHLVQWAQSLELARLSDELANTTREYLARYTELEPHARVALGDALARRMAELTAPTPPVWLSAPVFLSAVLAERRRRELARLAIQGPRFAPHTGPFGTAYAPPSPYGPPAPYAGPPRPTPYAGQSAGAVPQGEPTKVNAQGWHAPGSEPDQWS
jgi:hypothetical protein